MVDDQRFAPTYAPDLAVALVALIERGAGGLVHVTNAGSCTWHELAETALDLAGVSARVERITSEELALPARRPRYSVLSGGRYASLGAPPLRPWRDAIEEMLGR